MHGREQALLMRIALDFHVGVSLLMSPRLLPPREDLARAVYWYMLNQIHGVMPTGPKYRRGQVLWNNREMTKRTGAYPKAIKRSLDLVEDAREDAEFDAKLRAIEQWWLAEETPSDFSLHLAAEVLEKHGKFDWELCRELAHIFEALRNH